MKKIYSILILILLFCVSSVFAVENFKNDSVNIVFACSNDGNFCDDTVISQITIKYSNNNSVFLDLTPMMYVKPYLMYNVSNIPIGTYTAYIYTDDLGVKNIKSFDFKVNSNADVLNMDSLVSNDNAWILWFCSILCAIMIFLGLFYKFQAIGILGCLGFCAVGFNIFYASALFGSLIIGASVILIVYLALMQKN
jgi:uncharacterized membrane protein YphA (DoxX/SURF4 family)